MHCHSCSFMFRAMHVSSYSMVLVAVVRSFISCQVPHRGHAHRGRHRLQATVLDQGSHLMVHVGLVRSFVRSLLFCQVQRRGRHRPRTGVNVHLGPSLKSAVWSLVCFCQLNGVLNLNEVNIFVFQLLRLEHNKARKSQGIAVLIRWVKRVSEQNFSGSLL